MRARFALAGLVFVVLSMVLTGCGGTSNASTEQILPPTKVIPPIATTASAPAADPSLISPDGFPDPTATGLNVGVYPATFSIVLTQNLVVDDRSWPLDSSVAYVAVFRVRHDSNGMYHLTAFSPGKLWVKSFNGDPDNAEGKALIEKYRLTLKAYKPLCGSCWDATVINFPLT